MLLFDRSPADPPEGEPGPQLCLLRVQSPSDLPPVLTTPSPRFVALVVWDSKEASIEEMSLVADRLVDSGAAYVCTFGSGCERLHDVTDETLVDRSLHDPSWDGRHVMTTWHDDESLSDALWFWLNTAWPDESASDGCESKLAILIGVSEETAERVNYALAHPEEFTAQVLADEDASSHGDPSMQHQASIRFPITVTWKGGEVEHYEGLPSLCSDLEDFSNWNNDEAKVIDANGQTLLLIISVTSPLTIMPMPDDVEDQTIVRWSDGRIVDHATLLSEADNGSSVSCLVAIAIAGGVAYLLS